MDRTNFGIRLKGRNECWVDSHVNVAAAYDFGNSYTEIAEGPPQVCVESPAQEFPHEPYLGHPDRLCLIRRGTDNCKVPGQGDWRAMRLVKAISIFAASATNSA